MGVPQFRDATLFLRRTTICQNSNFCNQSVESHLFKVLLQTSVLPYAIQLLPQIFPFLLLVIKTWSFHISHMLFILCMIHYPFQHHQSMPAAHNLLVFAVKTYISVGSTASVQFFSPYYTILFFLHLPLLPLCLLIIFIFFSCYFDFFCLFLLHPFCLQSHSPIIFLFAVTLFHNFFFPSTPSPKFWSVLPLTPSAFVTYFTCCAYISINILKDNF